MRSKNCERNIGRAIEQSPLIRLLLVALDQAGCRVTPHRHFACEPCQNPALMGGLDEKHNQILICSNNCHGAARVEQIVAHELVHLYDYCTANTNLPNNLDHLACTEIRASNLTKGQSWSFVPHRKVVESDAVTSIVTVTGVDQEKALEAVKKVFHRCYNNLEPVGRVVRNHNDGLLALKDFNHFKKVYRQQEPQPKTINLKIT